MHKVYLWIQIGGELITVLLYKLLYLFNFYFKLFLLMLIETTDWIEGTTGCLSDIVFVFFFFAGFSAVMFMQKTSWCMIITCYERCFGLHSFCFAGTVSDSIKDQHKQPGICLHQIGEDCWSRVIKCFEDFKSNVFDERLVLLLCFGRDLGRIECDPLLCWI